MFTRDSFEQGIRNLKETINGRALSSKQMRQEANKLSGMAKHELQMKKRHYGTITRSYLLAYALVRGRTFREVEPFGRVTGIRYWISSNILDALDNGSNGLLKGTWSQKEVMRWLAGSPEAEETKETNPRTIQAPVREPIVKKITNFLTEI